MIGKRQAAAIVDRRRTGRSMEGGTMSRQEETSGRDELNGELRGSFRSVLLGWTDPVSGESLTLRMRGEDGLADSLARLGFEVLGREDPQPRREALRRGRVWSFRAQRVPRVCSLRSQLTASAEQSGGAAVAG